MTGPGDSGTYDANGVLAASYDPTNKAIRVSSTGGGSGSSTLAGDTDVSITTPADKDVLEYQTSDSKWHNVAVQTAMNNLAGAVTSGSYLRGNATNVVMSAIQAGDVPTLNQNTTGTASNVTGTVAIAKGGTGATTQQTALDAVAGAVTNNTVLAGDGTHVTLRSLLAADIPSLDTSKLTTGTLGVTRGGTGLATVTAHNLVVGNGTSAPNLLAPGTGGQALVSAGASNDPVYTMPIAAAATGITGSSAATLASYDRRVTANAVNAGAATSGTLRLWLIPLPNGFAFTNVTAWAGTTAGASLTHSWAVLTDSSRTVIAKTSDVTTASWTASTSRTWTFGSTQTITTTAAYYIGWVIAGTTIPTIEAASPLVTGGARVAAPIVGGNSTTGLSVPGDLGGTAGAITELAQFGYFELS